MSLLTATALTAFAVPEKRWCQAMSNGFFHSPVVVDRDTSPQMAHGLGDSVLH
ncbi:MAG: hypothetical protein ACXW11_00990 [Methylotenera sp.]